MHQECGTFAPLWSQVRSTHMVWRLENPLPTGPRTSKLISTYAWIEAGYQRGCNAAGANASLPSYRKARGQWISCGGNLEQQTRNAQLQSHHRGPYARHYDWKLWRYTRWIAYAARVVNRRGGATILHAQTRYYSRAEWHAGSVEINRNTTLWSHNSVWNKKYMDPYPGYTLQQLWEGCSFFPLQTCIFSASQLFLPQTRVFFTSCIFSASWLIFFTSSFFHVSKKCVCLSKSDR